MEIYTAEYYKPVVVRIVANKPTRIAIFARLSPPKLAILFASDMVVRWKPYI